MRKGMLALALVLTLLGFATAVDTHFPNNTISLMDPIYSFLAALVLLHFIRHLP